MSEALQTTTVNEAALVDGQNISAGAGDVHEGQGYGTSTYGERLVYKEKGCCVDWKDRGFAVCYYVHICVMILLAIALPAKYFGVAPPAFDEYTPSPIPNYWSTTETPETTWDFETPTTNQTNYEDDIELDLLPIGGVIGTVIIQCIVAVLFGILWLKLIEKFASTIIKVILFLVLGSLIALALLFFALKSTGGGIIGLIFVALYGIYIYCVWGRIPFSSALLKISSSITQSFEGTIWLSFGIIPFNIGWNVIIVCSGVGLVFALLYNEASGVLWFITFLILILSHTWGHEVNKNVLHTTICGVCATWYFSKEVHKPTIPSLKRSLTTSFGSICLGSLIVAILSAIEALIKPCNRGPLKCCVCCILKCIKKLIRYFNQYAFAQVAIYGCNFIQAAKQTWGLLLSRGLTAIIKDSLAGQVILFGNLLAFVVCFFIGWLLIPTIFYSKSWKDSESRSDVWAYKIIACVIGGIFGFAISSIILRVVQSTIIALFVCFAEDPNALKENRPLQYDMLVSSKLELQRMGETGHTGIDEGSNINESTYQKVEPINQAKYANMSINSDVPMNPTQK